MCGIAGIACFQSPQSLGSVGGAMLRRLAHRGPDDHGWLSVRAATVRHGQGTPHDDPADVLLLHRRLAILDLSPAGRQPMSSADDRHHLVFNGEIYNYRELRTELEKTGHTFRTQTDTEVLLAALAQWGSAAIVRLVGMFAFAFLDTARRSLLLARDFFGVKPLYFTRSHGRFAFASEIKALLELPGLPRKADPTALHEYLASGITSYGRRTLLADVEQLPAGHLLEIPLDAPGQAQPEPYWRIEADRPAQLSFPEAAARFRELFLQSVELHLRSDVPVGVCLSGGLDSSAILAGMRHLAGPRAELHGFSYIAADPRYSEQRWVDVAAAAAKAQVHTVAIDPRELCTDLDALVAAQDEPFHSTSIYAQYRVFRLAQETGVKVLLDGQGADELLAGYRGYLHARLAGLLARGHWLQGGRFAWDASRLPGVRFGGLLGGAVLAHAPAPLARGVARLREGSQDWIDHEWFSARASVASVDRPGPPRCLRAALLGTIEHSSLPMLLRYEDRNSMAHSIEGRVPFLTPALAQFVFSLPEEYLIDDHGTSKSLLRAALRGIVPDAILNRKDKIGFETPEAQWLQASAGWATKLLGSEAARSIGAWHWDRVRDKADRMLAGRQRIDGSLWRCLNLVRWTELLGVTCN